MRASIAACLSRLYISLNLATRLSWWIFWVTSSIANGELGRDNPSQFTDRFGLTSQDLNYQFVSNVKFYKDKYSILASLPKFGRYRSFIQKGQWGTLGKQYIIDGNIIILSTKKLYVVYVIYPTVEEISFRYLPPVLQARSSFKRRIWYSQLSLEWPLNVDNSFSSKRSLFINNGQIKYNCRLYHVIQNTIARSASKWSNVGISKLLYNSIILYNIN